MSRRSLLKGGGAALAGLSVLRVAGPAHAFPGGPAARSSPGWTSPRRIPSRMSCRMDWEQLDSWLTPTDQFFVVKHYGSRPCRRPTGAWRSAVWWRPADADPGRPQGAPRQEVTFTLECSGNTGLPFFTGGVGNATWAGTPLAPLLEARGSWRGQRGRLLGRGRRRGRMATRRGARA